MAVRKQFVALVGLARCCEAAVLKGQGPTSLAEVLQILDADKSGSVEKREMEVYAKEKGLNALDTRREFTDLDKNSDGSIGSMELLALGAPSAKELLAQSMAIYASYAKEAEETEAEDRLLEASERFVPALETATSASLVQRGGTEVVGSGGVALSSAIPQSALKDLQATAASQAKDSAKLTKASKPAPTDQKMPPDTQAPQVVLAVAGDGGVEADTFSAPDAVLMDTSSLLLEVRGQSNRAVAEAFSRQAEELLAERAANDEQAARLEERARGFREDAAELLASVHSAVVNAAQGAVQEESRQGFTGASALKEQADEAEQEASKARMEAQDSMEIAKRAQGIVMGDIQQLRASSASAPVTMRGV